MARRGPGVPTPRPTLQPWLPAHAVGRRRPPRHGEDEARSPHTTARNDQVPPPPSPASQRSHTYRPPRGRLPSHRRQKFSADSSLAKDNRSSGERAHLGTRPEPREPSPAGRTISTVLCAGMWPLARGGPTRKAPNVQRTISAWLGSIHRDGCRHPGRTSTVTATNYMLRPGCRSGAGSIHGVFCGCCRWRGVRSAAVRMRSA